MIWILLFLKLSFAGTIAIQTTSDLTLTEINQQIKVQGNIAVKNAGNDQAQAVYIEVLEPKISSQIASVSIAPNEQHKWEIESVNLGHEKTTGITTAQVPVVFLVNYQDINGYQFSAPSVAIAGPMATTAPKVTASIGLEGDGEYKIQYQIKNESDAKIVFRANLVLPKELQLVTRQAPVEVAARGETLVSYQVAVKGALGGSRYNIFLLLKWRDGNRDLAASFIESLEIKQQKKRVQSLNFEDWVLVGLMLIAGNLAFYLFRNWIRKA